MLRIQAGSQSSPVLCRRRDFRMRPIPKLIVFVISASLFAGCGTGRALQRDRGDVSDAASATERSSEKHAGTRRSGLPAPPPPAPPAYGVSWTRSIRSLFRKDEQPLASAQNASLSRTVNEQDDPFVEVSDSPRCDSQGSDDACGSGCTDSSAECGEGNRWTWKRPHLPKCRLFSGLKCLRIFRKEAGCADTDCSDEGCRQDVECESECVQECDTDACCTESCCEQDADWWTFDGTDEGCGSSGCGESVSTDCTPCELDRPCLAERLNDPFVPEGHQAAPVPAPAAPGPTHDLQAPSPVPSAPMPVPAPDTQAWLPTPFIGISSDRQDSQYFPAAASRMSTIVEPPPWQGPSAATPEPVSNGPLQAISYRRTVRSDRSHRADAGNGSGNTGTGFSVITIQPRRSVR